MSLLRPAFVAVFLAVFAAAFLLSCGGDGQSTQQDGTSSGTTSSGATTKTSRTGTSTSGRTGTSTGNSGTTNGHSSIPSGEQIQQDLIGKSINDPELGEWTFEDESEFVSFTIESQKESDNRIEFVVGMKLKDIGDGRLYNGQATVVYTKVNGKWQLSDVSGEYRSGGPSV
ncbi:MAG: hypothetical protein Q7K29_01835 [Thermoleophilia bacterium]|nr:hypothetical protein [Thermoleophilia bacterium]